MSVITSARASIAHQIRTHFLSAGKSETFLNRLVLLITPRPTFFTPKGVTPQAIPLHARKVANFSQTDGRPSLEEDMTKEKEWAKKKHAQLTAKDLMKDGTEVLKEVIKQVSRENPARALMLLETELQNCVKLENNLEQHLEHISHRLKSFDWYEKTIIDDVSHAIKLAFDKVTLGNNYPVDNTPSKASGS